MKRHRQLRYNLKDQVFYSGFSNIGTWNYRKELRIYVKSVELTIMTGFTKILITPLYFGKKDVLL